MTTPRPKRRFFQRAKSEINITPLIDVLLVLIVIFMVIAPVPPAGLETRVPQPAPSDSSNARDNETLVLTLGRNGGVRLNSEDLEPHRVVPRLQEIFSVRSDRTLFVQADQEVLFNEVAQVIDTVRSAGAERVGLLSEPLPVNR